MRIEPLPAPIGYTAAMKDGPDIAAVAHLIGDPARANMVAALMAGVALTAGELAREAGVTPATASSHLAKLLEGGLLEIAAQGRHRYYRLSGPDVAELIERLGDLATRLGHRRTRTGPRDPALRFARVCYDHIAGEVGVGLYGRLVATGAVVASADGIALSPRGRGELVAWGIDVPTLEQSKRPVCRACLDWSQRQPHLAGSAGAAIASAVLDRGWATRQGRTLMFSTAGLVAFQALGA